MDFYELRHFCATLLLEMGARHADVAVQLGHTDGGALVMEVYGHPSEDGARSRLHAVSEASVFRARRAASPDPPHPPVRDAKRLA
jgi:site-specific recombinase XerD